MRLTRSGIDAIKTVAGQVFGPAARVVLFGSRVDDAKRGGDIDLLIEMPAEVYDRLSFLQGEGLFLARLKGLIGERKIDVLVRPMEREPSAMEAEALATGVAL